MLSCHTVMGRLSLILIFYCDVSLSITSDLIAHKKQLVVVVQVKTVLGKTFAGSPVNACAVELDRECS